MRQIHAYQPSLAIELNSSVGTSIEQAVIAVARSNLTSKQKKLFFLALQRFHHPEMLNRMSSQFAQNLSAQPRHSSHTSMFGWVPESPRLNIDPRLTNTFADMPASLNKIKHKITADGSMLPDLITYVLSYEQTATMAHEITRAFAEYQPKNDSDVNEKVIIDETVINMFEQIIVIFKNNSRSLANLFTNVEPSVENSRSLRC